MVEINKIEEINFDKSFMYLKVNGKTYKIEMESVSKKLKEADELQRKLYKISPSGYGIHWPLIDEDLSLEQLLKQSA